jgi:hypothetical protein
VHFPQPIVLAPNKTYGVRVISAQFEYSFPNVNGANNAFVYERAGVQYTLAIPDGLYTFADLADDLADQMTANGHGSHAAPVLALVGNPAARDDERINARARVCQGTAPLHLWV